MGKKNVVSRYIMSILIGMVEKTRTESTPSETPPHFRDRSRATCRPTAVDARTESPVVSVSCIRVDMST